jgi:hypothetical protein
MLHLTNHAVAYPGSLFRGEGREGREGRGGVQQTQLRTEGRKIGGLEAVDPYSGVPLNLQMSETRILISLLQMYFPRNWEFGSALSKLRNLGGGSTPPPNTPRYATATTALNVFASARALLLVFRSARH